MASQFEYIMDKQYEHALRIIYNEKRGIIKDLLKSIPSEVIDVFISVGFITCGFTPNVKTWHISSLGQEYYEVFISKKL